MFALGESAEKILVLMDTILLLPPREVPSVGEMFENLEIYLGATRSTHLQLKNTLINLISQALRIDSENSNPDVRLVDFIKYVKRQQKAKGQVKEAVRGLEHWLSDEKFHNALSQASDCCGLPKTLRSFSDSRRIMYAGSLVEADGSGSRRIEIALSGIKYPRPTFDMGVKLYRSGKLEADVYLSELLLRSPWKIADLESVQLDHSLQEVTYVTSRLLMLIGNPSTSLS